MVLFGLEQRDICTSEVAIGSAVAQAASPFTGPEVGLVLVAHITPLHGTIPAPSLHFCWCPAANERTFLSWCSMATTMGGVSSAMVGLSMSDAGSSEGRLISRKTVDLVSAVYVPVAIVMILYALFTYEWRSKFMHKKQVRHV